MPIDVPVFDAEVEPEPRAIVPVLRASEPVCEPVEVLVAVEFPDDQSE